MSRMHGNDDEGTRSDNDEHSDMQPPCPSRRRKGRRLGGRYEGGDARRGVRSISGAYAPACHVTRPLTTSEHPPSHQQPPLNPDNRPTSATRMPCHCTNLPPIPLTATSPTPTTHDPTNTQHNHRVTSPLFKGCGRYLHPRHTAATNNKKSRDGGVIPAVSSIQTRECGGPQTLLPQPAAPMNASAATNSAHECQRHCQQHPPTPAPLPTSNGYAPMLARLLTKVISGEHLYFSYS